MEAFTHPGVLTAIVAGVVAIATGVITALVTRKRDVSETALKALTILVEKQETRADKLEGKVKAQEERLDALDAEITGLQTRHRKLSEKYSVSVTYIVSLWTTWFGLRSRLRQAGIPHGEPPPIPEIIAVDMEHPPENHHD